MTLRSTALAAILVTCVFSGCKKRGDELSDRQVPLNTATPPAPGSHPGALAEKTDAGVGFPAGERFQRAETELKTAPGADIEASANLEEVTTGVRVEVAVSGAKPGRHAVVIHQQKSCEGLDEGKMGAHLAPRPEPHGSPSNSQHHLGDLGNIEVKSDGKGELLVLTAGGNLREGEPESLLGRAIVIYAGTDSGKPEQKDLGKPLACGVIRG